MNRTQEQIVERVRTQSQRDPFGMTGMDLLEWLDFEHAKEFLKPEVTAEQWAGREQPEPIRDQMIKYMDFAWEKANNCRGLSAGRSLNHYNNWLWLLGEDQLAESMLKYEHYGKENLRRVCEFLGLDASKWDDGVRVNSESELD